MSGCKVSTTNAIQLDESISLPFLKWAGGKRWFAQNHLDLVPKKFHRYVEPFLGSGALFFRLCPRNSILSDINAELINTYISVRDTTALVEKHLKFHQRHHSKEYYYKVRSQKCRTDHTRAARFIYLNRTCWNALYRVNLKNEFNVPIGGKTSVLLNTDDFVSTAKLLGRAQINISDFEHIIDRAEMEDFVFVDPPYTVKHNYNGFIKYNHKLFSWNDQIRLRDAVQRASLRGAKVLVLNANHESVRELYEGLGSQTSLPRASILAASAMHRSYIEELAICTW